MKAFSLTVLLACACLLLAFGCQPGQAPRLPENFDQFSDSAKVVFLIDNFPPDSVAVMIACGAIAGKDSINGHFHIESINKAVNQAYLAYNDSAKIIFGKTLNEFTESLPLQQKFRLYYLSCTDNPYRLGYRMARELIETNNTDSLSEKDICEQIEIMETVAGQDSVFFTAFKKGYNIGIGGK